MSDAPTASQTAHQQQTVRRLETFSDIVIAFTLSQLAFTLRVPQHSSDLIAHPFPVTAFLFSFILVCGLWWLHHRLFSKYFFPDTASVLLNFAFLAATVYVAYSLLLVNTFGDKIALGAYSASTGCAFGLLAVLLAKGVRDPRLGAGDPERHEGAQLAIRVGIVGIGAFVAGACALLGQPDRVILAVWLGTALVVLILRLVRRRASSGAVS